MTNDSISPALRSSSFRPLSQTKIADLPSMAGVASELAEGYELAGRYRIETKIGEGGMGAVYRAWDENREESIAIKMLRPELARNDKAHSRFMDEAKLSSRLTHPHIVNVYDVQKTSEGLCFLTMELLQGTDLRHVIGQRHKQARSFAIDEVVDLFEQIKTALVYAHKSTVHRDIKPENIWVTEEGEYKLMDFGIACLLTGSQNSKTGVALGTAYYMPPEQLKGNKEIDGRADQYAMGVLMYELLTGEIPTGMAEPVRELRSDCPEYLAEGVEKMMSPKVEKRFSNIEEFKQLIQKKETTTEPTKASNKALRSKPLIIALIMVILSGFPLWFYFVHLAEQTDVHLDLLVDTGLIELEEQAIKHDVGVYRKSFNAMGLNEVVSLIAFKSEPQLKRQIENQKRDLQSRVDLVFRENVRKK